MSEGTWQQGATGWTLHTVSGFAAGVQNVGARQFSVDHDNTFYVEQDGTYLAQTLGTTFNSTNDYSLSLSIGWRLDQPVSEYSVELWAGGTRLGFIDQSQVTEVQGSLVQATLQVSGAGFPALNGQALQIRLVGVVMQTNFDNLQLVSYERNTEIGAAAVMTVDITPVNDAPVLADTALSVTVTEDAGVPSGVVGSLVSAFTGGITDVDSGAAKGIAIMGSNETNGTWYYTTNGGSTWTAVGTVSDTSALLLADNGSTRLYFSPNADYNGTSTAALTVRAWDQTSGAVGTKVSTASNGGTTAFSSATDTIDVSVTPINDAPISTGGSVTGVEDTPVVFTWGQFNVSDVDSAMTANSALQIRSLPVLGSLQTLVDGDWKSVAVNQIITKATIDAGNLRYVPVSEQSGYDGYGVSGVGSQRNDYAQFSFAPVQGTPIMMNNPDAQADVIAEGTQQQSVTGWTVNTVSSYTAGVENPTSAQFSGDHDNTFFVESGGTWVGQILYTTPFNSANDYVLSLNVGCQSGLPASQYRIELWAGGTGLGSIDQTQVAEVPGSFTQVTLQVNGGAFASQDGQWFGLWMIGNSGKTYFDNIQLMSYDRNAEVGTAATMTIDITPVNDAPTDLSLSANTVAENAVNGTVVGTVNGTDPDSGDTKAYSLTDNAGGRFAINSVTGQITVANSSLLNYEVATSHNVTVRVTDSGGLTYDETFTINLTDVNEATPTITSNGGGATASISVVENTTAVTTVRATDGDTRQTLTYSISGGADATKFAINTSTGALSFVAAPNYEAPTDNGANNVYNVTVQVSDGNGGTDTQALAVTVTNVNESPTDLSLSASTVAENAANGTVVGTVTGSDVDAGDTKSYTLTNNAGGRFAINRTTGALTVANGTLLNYEAATSHSVTVRVTDRGGLTYDETFTITVTNVNEAPAGTNATVTINEDTTQTFTTANFGFSDVDAGDSFSAVRIETLPTAGTLTLSGTAVTAGQVITTADVAAGNLVFTPAANANGTGYARFTFSVRDSNNAYDPTPNTLTVNVTAINDAPTDLSLSASTVAENAANGTVVGTVTGSDVDAGDTKSYTLTNNAGGRFAINRTTGALTVANGTLLNYEAATSHSVTVRVTDRGGLTYDETFTITVTNVNEAPAGTNATVTINEDTTQTFTTANFGFSDVDAGDSFSAVRIETLPTAGTLTLSGTAVTAGQVITTADVAAGNLVFTPAANANGTGYARFTFSVRDSNNAYDPTPNTLTVNVTAVNDAPVVATNSGSNVAEGGVDRITSAELAVVDVDNSAAQLRFSVGTSPAHGRLELTTAPGVSATTFTQADIAANRVTYVHDGSETLSDSFTFTVSDGVGGSIGTTTVTLTIAAVNDAPTIISDGGGATASINVAENVIGITVVTGADVDIPAQALTYGISGGADQALFTINATTGALSFVAPRDFEAAADANGDNVYVVQVRVTDSQGGMATQTIAVTVTDVAERLPSAVPLLPPSLIPTAPPPVIASAPPTHELPSISVPQEDVSGVILPAKGLPIESRSLAEHAEGRPAIAAPPRDDNSRRDERPTVALAARQDEGEIRNPFTILPVEFVASDRTAGLEPTISVSEVLMTKLDELAVLLQEAIGENQKQQAMVAHVTALTGTALSVGFVAWAIRSGALLASCFATIPAWRAFDPLPVVSLSRRERTRRSQDTEATRQAEEAEFEGLHGVLGTSSVTQQPPHSSKKGAA
ncbi:MAG TPA: cadherin-like domain-containing protein [Nitrospira sp.]|nr:cadherin-like domain-containing protein [Nitrospira sp.]